LVSAFAQAQDPVITLFNDDEQITDGFVYNAVYNPEEPDDLNLLVTNVSDSNVRLKLKMVNIENGMNNEEMVQFCFGGNCYFEVEEGSLVGPNDGGPEGLLLEPGMSNSDGDHFFSVYQGDDTSLPVQFDMAFVSVAPDGTEGETLMTFSYRYDATLSTKEISKLQNMGISVKNTIVNSIFEIESAQPATLELFDISGKKVKNITISEGAQVIDLAGLTTAIYIAKFTNSENQTSQIRIVKN